MRPGFDRDWHHDGAGLSAAARLGSMSSSTARADRRAGTMAERLFVELGVPAEEAIAGVRARRLWAI